MNVPYSIELQPQSVNFGIVKRELKTVRNDLATEMPAPDEYMQRRDAVQYVLVDKTGRRELCDESMAKHFLEPALVMIKALLRLVVHGANVDDNVTCIQHRGIPTPLHVCLWDLDLCEDRQLAD